jgi:L-ascorbate metabolism protein UlaG (beta-lactamase superfamily)
MKRAGHSAIPTSSSATLPPRDPSAIRNSVAWLGHSCTAIRLDGILIVTDPVFRRRVFHLRRETAVESAALADAHAILVSHTHYDHLDLPSLDQLNPEARCVVPAGAGELLRRRGFRHVSEVVSGDELELGPLRVRATHAEHTSSWRPGSGRTKALGFVITGTRTVYFAGDTDIFDGMRNLGRIDVALLPVAGWGPRLPPGHLDSRGAAEALDLIQPHVAIPIHWGTYAPWRPPVRSDAAAMKFAEIAATIAPAVDVRVLAPGQTYALD